MKYLHLTLALIAVFLSWDARADGLKLNHSLVLNLGDITPAEVQVDGHVQGLLVRDGYAFVFHHGGQVLVYDLDTERFVSSYFLPGNKSHCNNASFGTMKYSKKSQFPMAYVSDCTYDGSCYVYDLYTDHAVEVQRIFLTDTPVPVQCGTGWFVDETTGRLCMHWNGKVWDFPVPPKGRKTVRLTVEGKEPSGLMNNPVVHQGACAWQGYRFFPCGFAGEPTYLTVNETSTGRTWSFRTDGTVCPYEPEGVCGWDGGVYVSYPGEGRDVFLYRFEVVKGKPEGLTRYVNPFVGTGAVDSGSLAGNTFPGATFPFGMVQLSPDVEDFSVTHEGYEYGRDRIFGFSHTHQSGTGAADLQDILLMPSSRPLASMPEAPDQSSAFSHSQEEASPGYYRVRLEDHGIDAELTATCRTGMHRYTFAPGKENNILLDLVHGGVIHGYWQPGQNTALLDAGIRFEDPCTLVGYKISTGWERLRKVYFCIRFSRPVKDWYMWREYVPGSWWMRSKNVYHKDPVIQGKKVKAFLQFEGTGEPVIAKVGLSTVSCEGAAAALDAENPGWDFDAVRSAADEAWEKELSKVEIEGDEVQKRIFYTRMYHAFIQPNTFSDVDGSYTAPDHTIRKMPQGKDYYTTFSLWDTFRSAHPFYSIIQPTRNGAFVASLLAYYDSYGTLPMISYWGTEIYCMIGNHSIPVVVDAALKNLPGVDREKAFEAVKATSVREHESSPFEEIDRLGYIPYETQAFSVASTLEICYNDACVAALAEALGKTEDAAFFRKRAQNYRNLFDARTGFFRAKDASGAWREPFDPLAYGPNGDPYMEGNAWQYRFFVPHDMEGLIGLMGGKKAFEERLDSLFEWKSDPAAVASMQSSGRIGQYAHGNEPVHNYIYLYACTDHPEKVRKYAHEVMRTQYLDTPAGYSGNEDCGQMSSWFLLSSLGFHPIDPASGQFALGYPLYRKAVLHLENGNTFTVLSDPDGKPGRKPRAVRLNGKKLDSPFITYEDIMEGGTLEF